MSRGIVALWRRARRSLDRSEWSVKLLQLSRSEAAQAAPGLILIQIDGHDLMSSRAHGSEEELARRALAALGERPSTRVLVGGLGMGFTLRATLAALTGRRGAAVVVAEVFPAVVRWNRELLGHLAGRPLDDPRVRVEVADVADLLTPASFDVVLLDVDNGPEALTLASNRHLYGRRARDVVAAAAGDPALLERLHPDGPDIAAQALFALSHEWAMTTADVLRRRTTVALRGLADDRAVARVEGLLGAR